MKVKHYLIITVVLIVCISLVAGYYIHLQNNRYSMINSRDGYAYQLDKKTGESWVIFKNSKRRLDTKEESNNGSKKANFTIKDAINRVKNAKTLDQGTYAIDNDFEIRRMVENMKGELLVNGWKGEKINDQIYLIWYEIIHNGTKKTFAFEYNDVSKSVRDLSFDATLRKKYKDHLVGNSD